MHFQGCSAAVSHRRLSGLARGAWLLVISVVLLGQSLGCGMISVEPDDLPAELQAVLQGAAAVEVSDDDPMLALEPGTVIDPIAGLEGCWAAYYRARTDDGTPVSDNYEFYSFDAATGEMVYEIYQELLTDNPLLRVTTPLSVYVRYSGTFALQEPDTLLFTIAPNGLEVLPAGFNLEDVSVPDDPWVWRYLVTLDSDRLLLAYMVEQEDGSYAVSEDMIPMVYTRVACED